MLFPLVDPRARVSVCTCRIGRPGVWAALWHASIIAPHIGSCMVALCYLTTNISLHLVFMFEVTCASASERLIACGGAKVASDI